MTAEHRGGAWLKTPTRLGDALERVSLDAEAVWWRLSFWCSRTGARGVVPWPDLHTAVGRKIPERKARQMIEGELARPGVDLVEISDAGIDLGDWWREENPAAEIWHDSTQRERWARDKRLKRDSELCNRIKARDRNLCRYCGIRVNWNDKVGATGGTYDHVDPDGNNEFNNVVVACRQCNGRKCDRTPEQWVAEDPRRGRLLLRPGMTAAAAGQRAREGPAPGQPPADPRSTGSPRSRARPDRVNPGLTSGQPDLPASDSDQTRPSPGERSEPVVDQPPGGEP